MVDAGHELRKEMAGQMITSQNGKFLVDSVVESAEAVTIFPGLKYGKHGDILESIVAQSLTVPIGEIDATT